MSKPRHALPDAHAFPSGHTAGELRDRLRAMFTAADTFYVMAVRIGHHPFIEFTGLMREYATVCSQALEAGIDFSQCSGHGTTRLPMADHHQRYLLEKLGCIYSPGFAQVAEHELRSGR